MKIFSLSSSKGLNQLIHDYQESICFLFCPNACCYDEIMLIQELTKFYPSQKHILVPPTTTRAFTHSSKFNHITPVMADLRSTAISQYTDFQIWLRVFHYLRGTSLSLLSELASIYAYPQSLLSNNKSQIHQPPCQASHPWATEHSPALFPSCGIP